VRYLSACAPSRVERLALEALGDFPTSAETFFAIDVSGGVQEVSALPLLTRLARISVSTSNFRGVAIAPVADDGSGFDALVLPFDLPCLSVAEATLVPDGAAVSLLDGQDILVAGGARPGRTTALSSTSEAQIAEEQSVPVPEGLFVPRVHATALDLGPETWVLGGAQSASPGTPAFDSFERYAASSHAYVGIGRLVQARLRAAALFIPGLGVLVAGGEAEIDGAPRDTLEVIDVVSFESRLLDARLPFVSSELALQLRDDGVGVVTDGVRLLLFEPSSERLAELAPLAVPSEPSAIVTLPGERVAAFEIIDGKTTGRLALRLPNGEDVLFDEPLTPFSGLEHGRALGLRDGRLLLTGERAGRPTARRIDPGTSKVEIIGLPFVPQRLLLRNDGAVLLVGADAVATLRLDARTLHDNPGGTLLAEDADGVALDGVGRFRREGLALVSQVAGARFDLAGLSYEDVLIEVEAEGEIDLLLRGEQGVGRAVVLGADVVGPALCTLPRAADGRARIERRASTLTFEAGGRTKRCTLEGLSGRLRLAVRAVRAGATLRSLIVTRLE
jgi:hypothetical protein